MPGSASPPVPGAVHVFKDLTCRVCHAAIRKRTSTASAAEAQGRDETWRGRGPPEACAQDGRGTGAAGRRSRTLPSPGVSAGLGPKRQEKEKKDAGAAEPRAPQGSQTTLSFSSCPTF